MSSQPQSQSASSHERAVVARSVEDNRSLQDLRDGFTADGSADLEPEPVKFTIKEYQLFRAEYAMKNRDLVVHFFLPSSATGENAYQYRDWWLQDFPQALDEGSQEYFEAGPPRLMAKYTEELASWWFKAQGYDHLLDPLAYLERFLTVLDARLAQAAAAPR